MYSLNIGLTNRCNARCSFCPVVRTEIQREDMPFDLVKKIIREVDVEHHISLALFGESTLYPYLREVVSLVREKGVMSILYTNGIQEIKGQPDKVVFSLDAFTREDYKKTKGVDRFETVLENIEKYKGYKVAQFADLRYSKRVQKFIEKLPVDKVKFGRFISWGGEVEWDTPRERKIREPLPCGHLWKFMNIASNGDVVICCLDYNHHHVMGNVKQAHVMDVWDSEKFNEMRNKHLKGDLPEMCLNCENEDYYSTR